MKNWTDSGIELLNGKKIAATGGVLGLSPDGAITEGCAAYLTEDELSDQDLILLAKTMEARWARIARSASARVALKYRKESKNQRKDRNHV